MAKAYIYIIKAFGKLAGLLFLADDDLTALVFIAVTYNQAVTQLAVQPP